VIGSQRAKAPFPSRTGRRYNSTIVLRALPAILVELLVLLLCGCQSDSRNYPSHAPLLSASKEQLYKYYDQEVVITGRAENVAREGAVVVMGDGTRVVIPEMNEWSQRDAGKTVSVTGMLVRVPTATLASSGDVSKPDDRFVLKGVRWKAGKATTKRS
jgi:hypothetical protein